MIYYFVILLRLLFAPLILIWPLQSIIVSFFLDAVDADFAHHIVSKRKYQEIDKLLDSWVFLFEMILAWRIFFGFKYFLLFLFLWRIIGTIIFYIAKNRKIFLVFGNYFENAFFVLFFKDHLPNINIYLLLITSLIIKIFQEWFIHVADLSVREDLFGKKRRWKK